ncbi:MAG: hypothetical protein K1Y36_27300 [Blastocatellia bacterium]|nr:hypothetical protein [Blastocatellia bacterium]
MPHETGTRVFPIRYQDDQPLIAEFGGPLSQPGYAQVICGDDGEALLPVEVAERGKFERYHAWFECSVGLMIVTSELQRDGKNIEKLWRITEVTETDCVTEFIEKSRSGRFFQNPSFDWAALAAEAKVLTYYDASMYSIALPDEDIAFDETI